MNPRGMTRTKINMAKMDDDEADIRMRAMLKAAGFEVPPEECARLLAPDPRPEDFGLSSHPRVPGTTLKFHGMQLGWAWLMEFLSPHRDIEGRAVGISLDQCTITHVPAEYFSLPDAMRDAEAYGIRPADDSEVLQTRFNSEDGTRSETVTTEPRLKPYTPICEE